jgi:hypothetical protein
MLHFRPNCFFRSRRVGEYDLGFGGRLLRLAHIKQYARLTAQAGALDRLEVQMIHGFSPYTMQERCTVDAKRKQTRIGHKKARDTDRDRRDRVLLGLLADQNCSTEVAQCRYGRARDCFLSAENSITRQRLTHGLYDALVAYADVYPLPKTDGALIVASESYRPVLARRGLTYAGLQTRTQRLGQLMGIDNVSAHDFRHYAATEMARQGQPITELRDWFGWTRESTMPMRYIAAAEVATRGDLEAA